MQYQIMKEGMPIADFAEEADAKKFLEEKQERYVNDMYRERLHTYMEEHGIRYPGNIPMVEVDGILKRLGDESKKIFQLNEPSSDKDVYADKLVGKITPIFEEAKGVMDEDMLEPADGSTYYEYEDSYLELYSGINSFLAGGSEAKTLLNDCFTSDGDSKLEDMLISIRKNGLVAAEDVYPVLDSVRDLKRDYQGIEIVNRITSNDLRSNNEEKELTEKEKKKVERNKIEDKSYKEVIDKLMNNRLRSNDVIKIGTTPFSLRIVGAGVMPLIISQGEVRNCMEGQTVSNRNKKKHSEPHYIPVETVKEFSKALRNPICICKGNIPNTLLVVSDLLNKNNENIVFPIHLSVKGQKCEINKVMSAYGKKNIQEFLQNMYLENKILAVHKEKIDKCFVTQSNIGRPLPKFEAFTNYNDSIAYSTVNVKYSLKNFEKNKTPNLVTEPTVTKPFTDNDNIRGNEDYYRYFYVGEQDKQAEDFAREKGWKKILASKPQGLTFDTWIVYREISDLPKFLREYAGGQERSADRSAARASQTKHCQDKGSWAAMIANRKVAVSEKESNAAVQAQEQKPNIHKGDFGK